MPPSPSLPYPGTPTASPSGPSQIVTTVQARQKLAYSPLPLLIQSPPAIITAVTSTPLPPPTPTPAQPNSYISFPPFTFTFTLHATRLKIVTTFERQICYTNGFCNIYADENHGERPGMYFGLHMT